jgi:hypothetical protein
VSGGGRRVGHRRAAGLLVALTAVSGLILSQEFGARADDETITALPIRTFMSARVGERVQGLVWRGGIEMQSQTDTFGGLSGLGFTAPDGAPGDGLGPRQLRFRTAALR